MTVRPERPSVPRDVHDAVALVWTHEAVGDCLAQARQALERFAGAPHEPDVLGALLDHVHQVHGCLHMLELRGAAHLALEIEALAQALAMGQIGVRGDVLGALFKALEHLPIYLERLRSARRDLPLVIVPLINQLRACRGAEALSPGSLFEGELAGQRLAGADDLANLDLSLGAWRERLQTGQGHDALRSVVEALCGDLLRIKERLDASAREANQHGALEALLAPLRQVADTLAVLGFQQPRRVIIDQVLALQGLIQCDLNDDGTVLMDVAGALLYVEASLHGMLGTLEETGQLALPGTDLAQIRQQVLSEVLVNLAQVRDALADGLTEVSTDEHLCLSSALLRQAQGALRMLMLPELAQVLEGCAAYLDGLGRQAAPTPPAEAMAAFAEALSAAECSVQWRVADPQADIAGFLERAQARLADLGIVPGASSAESVLAERSVDAELRAVFLEEAQALLPALERHWLRWRAEAHSHAALVEVRRLLHTLKGSGRMVQAQAIAELAWAAEHVLNRTLEGRAALSGEAQTALQQALATLPDLLGEYAAGDTSAQVPWVDLAEHLHALALDPAQAPHATESLDPRLLDIFAQEAHEHVDVFDDFLATTEPTGTPVTDAVQRALHTLKGSAAMAGVLPIAELATALDRLVREYKAHQLPVTQDERALLAEAHRLLVHGLDALPSKPLNALPGADALIERLGACVDARLLTAQAHDGPAQRPRRDPQVIAGFLAQGMDLLLDAESVLSRWREQPGVRQSLDTLLDELTAFGQAAHQADLWQVDEVCEAVLDLYGAVEEGSLMADVSFFEHAQQAHETLIDMLDELAAGQDVTARPACVATLRALLEAALDPASTGLLSPEHGVVDLGQAPATLSLDDDRQPSRQAERPSGLDNRPVASADPHWRGDNELLDVFLEESADIVESVSASLSRWQADSRNTVEVDNLLRDLHTLKGGARMVQISAIGDLAHELEFLYEWLAAGQLPPSPALSSLLQTCHDRLAHMLDAVRLGQPLHAATALIDHIRNFSSAALNDNAARRTPVPLAVAEMPAALPERAVGDTVKVAAELLDDLGNLASEHAIVRGRVEQQINDAQVALNEMETTLERMRDQLLRLDGETQGPLGRLATEGDAYEDFDPLEMDRHSHLQQLSRALFEASSDLLDLKETLSQKAQAAQGLLLQQARVNSQLQEGLMSTRMVPFERLVPRLQRVVRQVASELGKQVELLVENAEGELDRSILERMVAPLEHMLRNAVDHGLESREARLAAGKPAQGSIWLNLLHEGADIVIEMSDDGAGVPLEAVRRKAIKRGLLDPQARLSDHEILQFILRPGFSTAERITQISGRGLGMDVVHEEVKQLGGSMSIASSPGKGATFSIRLPFAVSLNRALMVNLDDEQYAIPLDTLEGIVRVPPAELEACYQRQPPSYAYAGQQYQLRYLGDVLQGNPQPRLIGQSMPVPVLLVHSVDQAFAIQVDSLSPSREIVTKSLGPQFAAVPGLSGATLLGDGRVVLILDLLGQLQGQQRRRARLPDTQAPAFGEAARPPLILVVDDSVTVRKVTTRLLERHGMQVLTAKDGIDAMMVLDERRPDLVLLDIEMPRMDGFEVATRIRRDPRLHDLPIIMITSRTGQKHRERAMAIGVNEYLGKPYQESVLLQSIAQWSAPHA
ncbi:response regulator [Pseudomonas entomophila]|uniref:hybrid sensor histidine kinase/response regulator n=1 Tax=Pseudomonas entomophila TaxID=312306 RepID=UPI0015E395A6|nr:Hpt domain-containing protein [Pseudomonas entomophila]MBA1193990.1 response regulator [Pseudomonas entomophila]